MQTFTTCLEDLPKVGNQSLSNLLVSKEIKQEQEQEFLHLFLYLFHKIQHHMSCIKANKLDL